MKILGSLLTIALLASAPPVFAQSLSEATGVNSVLGLAPKTEDFIKEAAQSDMFEIQSSELAKTKAADAKVKDFATMMIAEHTKSSDELKSIMKTKNMTAPLPTEMSASQTSMIDGLNRSDASSFGRSYINDQISGHKSAVSLFQRYASGGENADLKAFAAKMLPNIQHHLDMAQGLSTEMKKSAQN